MIVPWLQPIMESVILCLQVHTTHSNRITPMCLPIAHQDKHATGGGTFAGCFSVDLRCSLLLLVLSSACRCLNMLKQAFEGPGSRWTVRFESSTPAGEPHIPMHDQHSFPSTPSTRLTASLLSRASTGHICSTMGHGTSTGR